MLGVGVGVRVTRPGAVEGEERAAVLVGMAMDFEKKKSYGSPEMYWFCWARSFGTVSHRTNRRPETTRVAVMPASSRRRRLAAGGGRGRTNWKA